MNEQRGAGDQDWRPRPDPTVLTTAALNRESDAIYTRLHDEIAALKELVFSRFTENDKAIKLIQDKADRVPSEVDLKVGALKELHGQRFDDWKKQEASISELNEKRVKDISDLNREALANAFRAAESSATRIEGAGKDQLNEIKNTFNTANHAADLRLNAIEGELRELRGGSKGQASLIALVFGTIGALAGLGGLVALVVALSK